MNEHDRNNLNFLLSLNKDPVAFDKWCHKRTDDDMDYAMELLAQYSKELEAESVELRIEAELEMLGGRYPQVNKIIAQVAR